MFEDFINIVAHDITLLAEDNQQINCYFMKNILFIRHGESEANAGLPTSDPAAITLTAKGFEQAKEVSELIDIEPDLVVMSSYLRTQQTAEPFLKKYSGVKTEIWPIHEFDFLSPKECMNTTVEQRKPWVKSFWDKCETDYTHGEDSESFGDFKSRVLASIKRLEESEEKNIIVFAHGHVMRAIWQYFITKDENIDMAYFRDNMSRLPVINTAIFRATFDNGLW
jgi:broad specificity phosphatase PhoE